MRVVFVLYCIVWDIGLCVSIKDIFEKKNESKFNIRHRAHSRMFTKNRGWEARRERKGRRQREENVHKKKDFKGVFEQHI